MSHLFISRLCAWAPGIETSGEWDQWARGKREIMSDTKSQGTQVPELSFTDSMFRRRLSQISKMTVQVVHGILPVQEDTKMFFVSFRGELSRQYQINKMLIEDKSLMPAVFSLSVFNAPAALASMAHGLKGGYTALYPGNNSFASGLAAAQAALVSGKQEELIFVYADEQPPPEYECLVKAYQPPLAFAFLLTRASQSPCVPFSELLSGKDGCTDSPHDFLKRVLLCGDLHVS